MLAYFLAIIPLYLFVYIPISNLLFGAPNSPSAPLLHLNSSFIASNEPLDCPAHQYTTHILSTDPLMIYIEDFLNRNESLHLLEISEEHYNPSTLSHGSTISSDPSYRHSEVALLPRTETVRCIEHRARAFQGWDPNLHIERLRTQRYGEGGIYKHHFDWSGASREQDRVSTFMVYVWGDGVEGGGTEFSRVRAPIGGGEGGWKGEKEWCRWVECEDIEADGKKGEEEGERKEEVKGERRMGVTFKPITGNAIFWHNLQANGRGYQETYHAGLPVLAGTKVGLNIWSWGSARDRR